MSLVMGSNWTMIHEGHVHSDISVRYIRLVIHEANNNKKTQERSHDDDENKDFSAQITVI